MNTTSFQRGIQRLVKDGAGVLDGPDYDFYIAEALKRYSKSKPRKPVADIAGDGSYDYDMPSPFDPEFSRVTEVEWPAGRRVKETVDALDWTLYESPTGTKLRFLSSTPGAGTTIRVTFTAMHTVSESSTTVPEVDHDVIHLLGAQLACEALSSHYSNSVDSTILADSVDHKSKASEYAARARRFGKMADELLPAPEQGVAGPAGGEISIGESENLLTHPER